jgi:signal transduction histidine kinase
LLVFLAEAAGSAGSLLQADRGGLGGGPDLLTDRLFQRHVPEARAGAHPAGVPGLQWYVALWTVLIAISLAILLVPGIPLAVPNPLLAVAVSTISGAVGLALLHLGALRFNVLGCALDLFVGLAFGTLALTNLVARALALSIGTEPEQVETSVYLFLLARLIAAVLFLAGLARADVVIAADARTWYGLRLGGSVAAVFLLGTVILLLASSHFPHAADPVTRESLQAGAVILDPVFEQEPWLVLARAALGVLLLLASIGYVRLSWRWGDRHVASLAVGLTLLLFAQLHVLLGGPLPVDYVSTADGFRLAAYLALLYYLFTRIRGEISERLVSEERLRLSRELHDGLAQQLSLLNLCLDRLAVAGVSPEQHARHLQTAKRLVEAASLEADQAITALRTGVVAWDAFVMAVSTFVDEFAQNHEVEVRLATEGAVPALGAELQAEVLRILHEACSNAVRHGGATRIDVRLAVSSGRLEMRVQDNGRGFDPDVALASAGVGVRSMTERLQRRGGCLRFEPAPERGATLVVGLPLARRRLAQR